MLKIVIPANMEATVSEHLKRAGRPISFEEGRDFCEVAGTGDQVIRLRSYDIPVEVGDRWDVGLCGSDWIKEKHLEHGIRPIRLAEFKYGRTFTHAPTLDLVVRKDDSITAVVDIEPGKIVITEHPLLTRAFLEDNGVRVAQLGKNHGAPSLPDEFRTWCKSEGFVGVRTVHGRIAALVSLGEVYGVLVNETGKTLEDNQLKIIDTVEEISTVLIANRDTMQQKEAEIYSLKESLERAYLAIRGEIEGSSSVERRRV